MTVTQEGQKRHRGPYIRDNLRVPIADALRKSTRGMASAAKKIATLAHCHERTAKRWLAAETEVSATELVRLMREFDEVYQVVMAACGRQEVALTDVQRNALRQLLGTE